MYLALYNFFGFLFRSTFSFVAFWNEKAKKGILGRRDQKAKLNLIPQEKSIWMHCASLGEFEQGRPIVEAIKQKHPSKKLIVSFFSASGHEATRNYELADQILYLPFDGKESAAEFIEYVNPELVIWVKYEYWFWFLKILKEKQIPVLLISAHFRNTQPFFKWYGGLHLQMISCFNHIFIQSEESIFLVKKILSQNQFTIVGDTRFDRVIALREEHKKLPDFVLEFLNDEFCVVAGSTWPEDELQLIHFNNVNSSVKFIIVPHEIDTDSIKEVKQRFKNHHLYSELLAGSEVNTNISVMIVDKIGVLSRLYQYADIAYIGGGFNESGIHNSLEAAVWGTAIVFGPVFQKFLEANQLIEIGAAETINNPVELENVLNKLFNDQNLLETKKQLSKAYVARNQGATKKILDYIQENRLLIN